MPYTLKDFERDLEELPLLDAESSEVHVSTPRGRFKVSGLALTARGELVIVVY
jgi:hypothetical protein